METITLKEFAANYFATKKYLYTASRPGELCTSFNILKPEMEDCGNYYLLSNFTVSHELLKFKVADYEDSLDFEDEGINYLYYEFYKDCIILDEKVNVKIKMNKNKTSNKYYNDLRGYDCFHVSSDLKFYNDYSYYPVKCIRFDDVFDRFDRYYYLSHLKHLVDIKDWHNRLSRFYFLVDPTLTKKEIQELRNPLTLKEQEIMEKLTPVEKEEFKCVYNLYIDIENKKIHYHLTDSMKKIILSYVSNISENVQFFLQDEIKEIYKTLNNIKDDMSLYVHNI